jgi:3',5'-cyclic AMP phosphodiesterase CpdA
MQDHQFRCFRAGRGITASLALTVIGLAGLFGTMGCVGCAGTSPQFNTPQMNTPTLDNGGISSGRSSGGSSGSSLGKPEAKLPTLERVTTPKGVFSIEPYLQPGNLAALGAAESVALRWQTADGANADKEVWTVEAKPSGAGPWQKVKAAPTGRKVTLPGQSAQRVWTTTISELSPGASFDFRVTKDEKPVFIGRARARKPAGQPIKFVVFGDCGAGTAGQKRVAAQAAQEKPDFVFITGDIVYDFGRASEYAEHFWPVYNADVTSPKVGGPLLRESLVFAAPGNHDVGYRQLDKWPDGMAYFYLWDLPKNGPELTAGGKFTATVSGSDAAKKAFLEASGDAYPRMANYSFDYGSTHWLVLDSNYYADWSDEKLRAWVEQDLSGAKNATWKFVAFHHPPFHSSKQHQEEQYMRVLCEVFEKHGVNIVFSGHVHNYQRSYPMKFVPTRAASGGWRDEKGRIAGKWTLDKTFDGKTKTQPNAPIYIVSGAGGGPLYDAKKDTKPEEWQEFTVKYIANLHSLTVVDVDAQRLTVRQLSDSGKELDKFILTKGSAETTPVLTGKTPEGGR